MKLSEAQLQRQGYVRLKRWITEESIREKAKPQTIWARVNRGYYRGVIRLVRVNPRVIFVKPL